MPTSRAQYTSLLLTCSVHTSLLALVDGRAPVLVHNYKLFEYSIQHFSPLGYFTGGPILVAGPL